MSELTFDMLKSAWEKVKEPPRRDVFKCKSCDKSAVFVGFEMTKKIDGLNYFICNACALAELP